MLIEANSDTSSVGPSNKDHPFLPDESVLIMQVVLKIYVYYNDKLFGIFHSSFIRTKSLVWMALSNIDHCTLLILLHVLCLITMARHFSDIQSCTFYF